MALEPMLHERIRRQWWIDHEVHPGSAQTMRIAGKAGGA
jgi:hypothetical protein